MTYLDALENLISEKCGGIGPKSAPAIILVIKDNRLCQLQPGTEDLTYSIDLNPHTFLGEWELINEIIRPQPGDVWEKTDINKAQIFCFVLDDECMVDLDGTVFLIDITMIHGKNNWTQIFSLPKENEIYRPNDQILHL